MQREELLDADGRVLADDIRVVRDGLPCADEVVAVAGVGPVAVARALRSGRPGWLIGTDEHGLVSALRAVGAIERRHAFMLELELGAGLRAPGPPPAGVTTEPLPEVTDALGALTRLAYPRGHPDHRPGETDAEATAALRDYVLGRAGWVALPGACRVATCGGRPVAVAILNRVEVPGHDTPIAWVTELFRLPGARTRGVGAILLDETALAARDLGLTVLGLAVSARNPARVRYDRRGFRAVSESWTLALPGVAPPG